MELLVLAGFVLAITYWIYKAGKREGSRKGFNAGMRRRRFRR